MQRRGGQGFQFRRGLDDREPSPHGAFGIMLMGVGIAKKRENSVAHIFGDKSAVGRDQGCAALVICSDDAAHVLRIEPSRHRRRSHEVAEHDGELAAFGSVHGRRRSRLTCLS